MPTLNFKLRSLPAMLMLALLLLAPMWASALQRGFPQDSRQTSISAFSDPYITLKNGTTLHLAPGVLVYSTDNLTIVRAAIPTNVYVRIQLDAQGDVRRIWVLNPDEIQ